MPIKKISEHARAEKNLRTGHPWHLHIWWARRPWGACRAITLASLLPAPTDLNCSEGFIKSAYEILAEIGFKPKSQSRNDVQNALLRFIAEFASWDFGNETIFCNAARSLVSSAYPEQTPMVFDSFAGYGAIPGEAARLGCDSFAFDLNPVAVLCMRTILDSVPKYGHKFIEEFIKGAEYVRKEAEKRLRKYYPDFNARTPIAWLWARTVTCEGPGCGTTVPLISQTTIAKGSRKVWIEISGDKKTKQIHIHIKQGDKIPPFLIKTAGGGHAVCPVCGYTTNKSRVKIQGKEGRMGHRLYGVAVAIGERQGKEYIDVRTEDIKAFELAELEWLEIKKKTLHAKLTEKYPAFDPRAFTAGHYGITTWGDIFSSRQKLALYTLNEIIHDYEKDLEKTEKDTNFIQALITALALSISNYIPYGNNLGYWGQDHMNYCYKGMGISMKWDWAEANPLVKDYAGGLDYSFQQALGAIKSLVNFKKQTSVMSANAVQLPMPDDSADIYFADPPYYDVVPYADLSDLSYVWLKRFIGHLHPDLFSKDLTPKVEQVVVNPYAVNDGRGEQSAEYYQERMTKAFSDARRVLKPDGIGAIVFAHKGTSAWENLLSSILDAGFIVTASWPIDTERSSRMRANSSSALGSSVHLVVRPRENPNGSLINDIGDWRDVLQALPKRIHEWMQRLAKEGIVGADAIFACLGPALEIFSKYSHVEKANGDKVELSEYLEQVWAAVAKEALNMIFEGAHTEGFEEDSRLTAMWLWTLSTAKNGNDKESIPSNEEAEENISEKAIVSSGFTLEFDAARKIAQGLGARLENLSNLIEIKGGKAKLLPVSERVKSLFGKDSKAGIRYKKRKKEEVQLSLFDDLKEVEEEGWSLGDKQAVVGKTVLDRLHQSMILFGAGRGDALRRFLVEEGIGRDERFWRLAQALSALYPSSTDEKRWVDGVMAKKKSFGF
ncbi:MAG: DUF1156 domain-containing protein [Nitrospirota bacterium]